MRRNQFRLHCLHHGATDGGCRVQRNCTHGGGHGANRGGSAGRFTLIELLVVIAIIAVLASLLMSSLRTATEYARKGACASNLHQIYTGLLAYIADYNGFTPYGTSCPPGPTDLVDPVEKAVGYQSQRNGRDCIAYCPSDKRANIVSGNFTLNKHGNWMQPPLNGIWFNYSYSVTPYVFPAGPTAVCFYNIPKPSDTLVYADGVARLINEHNGMQQFSARHVYSANIAYADGHVAATPMGAPGSPANPFPTDSTKAPWWPK